MRITRKRRPYGAQWQWRAVQRHRAARVVADCALDCPPGEPVDRRPEPRLCFVPDDRTARREGATARAEGGEQYVGVMSGIVSDRMSGLCRYFVGTMSGVRRDYVGIASGLCRGYVGAMSGFGLPYVGSKSKPRRRDMPQKGPPRPSLAN